MEVEKISDFTETETINDNDLLTIVTDLDETGLAPDLANRNIKAENLKGYMVPDNSSVGDIAMFYNNDTVESQNESTISPDVEDEITSPEYIYIDEGVPGIQIDQSGIYQVSYRVGLTLDSSGGKTNAKCITAITIFGFQAKQSISSAIIKADGDFIELSGSCVVKTTIKTPIKFELLADTSSIKTANTTIGTTFDPTYKLLITIERIG